MAKTGTPAFSPDSHKELLKMKASGIHEIQLALHFDVSVPTIYTWLKRPLAQEDAPKEEPAA